VTEYEEYEKALNEVAGRLRAAPRREDESFNDWSQRIHRLARQRNRKLWRWLRHEHAAHQDRLIGDSNLI
jgi:hypothetical protein